MTIELSKLGERFSNAAGEIVNLLERPCGGVSLIYCKAGESRSHHVHKTDAHELYVVYGEMKYVEQRDGEEQKQRVVHAGQMVWTGPGTKHSSYFDVDTLLISMSDRARTKAEHEADLVRVEPLVWKE
jgi:quercetin dioxygenase-like cupin family protein